jgi:ribonuclease P protein component
VQRRLRLRDQTDFQRLRAEGRKRQHSALTLSFTPNHLPHNRYGFILGKRLGKAVIRNRLRRRLQACLRSLHVSLLQGYDVVFIPRQACLKLDYQELCGVVSGLVRQAGLWNNV